MSTIQIAGGFYSWKSGTWEPQNDRSPLRVFRFRGDAWQCPRDVRVCRVKDVGGMSPLFVAINGYTSEYSHERPEDAPVAVRLSTWAEWFDLTLAAAAHQYLDELMRARRKNYRASAFRIGIAVHEMCEVQTAHDLIDFGSSAYEQGVAVVSRGVVTVSSLNDYLRAVKADLEARLRGEPGNIVLP
jgi:hypothetical protein